MKVPGTRLLKCLSCLFSCLQHNVYDFYLSLFVLDLTCDRCVFVLLIFVVLGSDGHEGDTKEINLKDLPSSLGVSHSPPSQRVF